MAVGYYFCLGEVFKLHMLNICLGLPSFYYIKEYWKKQGGGGLGFLQAFGSQVTDEVLDEEGAVWVSEWGHLKAQFCNSSKPKRLIPW